MIILQENSNNNKNEISKEALESNLLLHYHIYSHVYASDHSCGLLPNLDFTNHCWFTSQEFQMEKVIQ